MTYPQQQREIGEHALAVLGTFLGDYTDPDEDGHCARVVVLPGGGVSQGYFDVQIIRAVRVEDAAPEERVGIPPRFRVSVTVAPAPYPVVMTGIERDEASGRGGMSSRDESDVVRPVSGSGNRA